MCDKIPLFFSVLLVVAYAADQSQVCQETISMGCASYQPIEADETVCGTDGSHYNNFCEFGVAKCKDPSLDIASLGQCGNGQTTATATMSTTPTTKLSTTTVTTTVIMTTTQTMPPQTSPTSNSPTTMGPEHNLICDNKDTIQCPNTVDRVCGSDGVIYKNSCEFTKATCSNDKLTIQSMSSCTTTTTTTTTGKPTTLDPTQQLFCDNKDFITCPSVVNHVCASNGVVYNNECEFTKVKCTNSALTIQPSSFCRPTF